MPTLTPSSGKRSRLPSRPDAGYSTSAAVVEAGFDQDAASADRLGIFGDERALLGRRESGNQQDNEREHTTLKSGGELAASELSAGCREDRDRPVVDELDLHHGLELAGRDGAGRAARNSRTSSS